MWEEQDLTDKLERLDNKEVVILDEDGKKFQYDYPKTIQHDIQKRPNLPPPPYTIPIEVIPKQLWTYSYTLEEEVKVLDAEGFSL